MKLSIVYERSKGVLTRGERDLYLAWCSFADNNTGECFPRKQTVAARAGILPQSASRMYRNLIGHGFLMKTEDGHRCLVGFKEGNAHEVKKTKHDVKFSDDPQHVENGKLNTTLSENAHHVNSHIKDRTTHLTTHLEEEEKPPQHSAKPTQKQERVKTRPDLSDEAWLEDLRSLPENRGISVAALWARMLSWCAETNSQPSRLRMLKWLERERADVPVDLATAYRPTNSSVGLNSWQTLGKHDPAAAAAYEPDPPCTVCGSETCLRDHRFDKPAAIDQAATA